MCRKAQGGAGGGRSGKGGKGAELVKRGMELTGRRLGLGSILGAGSSQHGRFHLS